MNSNYPKIYFGPMSKNIVDTLLALSNEYPIGFIPSRRQVEYTGGYVNRWTSRHFCEYVKADNPDVLVCRDHGGRSQGNHQDDGTISFQRDCESKFDIIHVDPWKNFTNLLEVATETADKIKFCLSRHAAVKFEVGTEEAIHKYSSVELEEFLGVLQAQLGAKFQSILYAVVQFGTEIRGTKNIGEFDIDRAQKMIAVCKKFDLLSKEHNGDYLTPDEIKLRFTHGLDAINIAPEYGVYETECLINYFMDEGELTKLDMFSDLCRQSNQWRKWLPTLSETLDVKWGPFHSLLIARVAGHYVFGTDLVKQWKKEDPHIDETLKRKLTDRLRGLLEDIYSNKGKEKC